MGREVVFMLVYGQFGDFQQIRHAEFVRTISASCKGCHSMHGSRRNGLEIAVGDGDSCRYKHNANSYTIRVWPEICHFHAIVSITRLEKNENVTQCTDCQKFHVFSF